MRTPARREQAAGFRPDIEGLRAIAVLGVVLFHAHLPQFGGGFVGVDVFYVLSGFLITSLLLKEIDKTNRIDLIAFWGRRMRRLLPAAALVLAVTAAASLLALDPLSLMDALRDIIACAVYIGNWQFAAMAVDYLATDTAPSPVLHYWSLGVEEQFYVIWPLLFVAVLWLGRRLKSEHLRRRQLGAMVLLVGVSSFIISLALTYTVQPYAFFGTHARAWQLALGAGVAIAAERLRQLPAVAHTLLGWLGLFGVVYAMLMLSDANADTPYPGWVALLPTVSTCALVVGGLRRADSPVAPLTANGMLSFAPLRYIGRVSYSWYLWHWPPLVLIVGWVGHEISVTQRLIITACTFGLAVVTYHFVEDPVRRAKPLVKSRWSSIVVGLASSAAVIVVANLVPNFAGQLGTKVAPPAGGITLPDPTAPSKYAPGVYVVGPREARDDRPVVYRNGCQVMVETQTTQPECLFGDKKARKSVVLFGDSHAAQWFPALESAASTRGYRFYAWSKSGCPWYEQTVWNNRTKTAYAACDEWRRGIFAKLKADPPDVLVLGSIAHFYQVKRDGSWLDEDESQPTINGAIAETLRQLRALPSRIVVLHDTPHRGQDVPGCVAKHLQEPQFCAMPRDEAFSANAQDAQIAATVPGVMVADFTKQLCGPAPMSCPVVLQGIVLYRDSNHITATYSRLLAPLFYDYLK